MYLSHSHWFFLILCCMQLWREQVLEPNGWWLWNSWHLTFPLLLSNNCLSSSVDLCVVPIWCGLGNCWWWMAGCKGWLVRNIGALGIDQYQHNIHCCWVLAGLRNTWGISVHSLDACCVCLWNYLSAGGCPDQNLLLALVFLDLFWSIGWCLVYVTSGGASEVIENTPGIRMVGVSGQSVWVESW